LSRNSASTVYILFIFLELFFVAFHLIAESCLRFVNHVIEVSKTAVFTVLYSVLLNTHTRSNYAGLQL